MYAAAKRFLVVLRDYLWDGHIHNIMSTLL